MVLLDHLCILSMFILRGVYCDYELIDFNIATVSPSYDSGRDDDRDSDDEEMASDDTEDAQLRELCRLYIKINDILIITVSVVMSMNTDTVQCARRRDNVD